MKFKFSQYSIALFIICISIVFTGVEICVLVNENKQLLSYAEESFKRAIDIDLNKRWKKAGFDNEYVMRAHSKDSVTYPLKIRGVSEDGKYCVLISKEKDSQNINPVKTEYAKRIMQSILSDTSDTIQIDTLQLIWKVELEKEGIEFPVALRMDCCSTLPHTTLITTDTLTKSLSFYYIGSRFEISIRSYIQVSYLTLFIKSLSGNSLFVLIAYVLVIFLFICVRGYYLRKKKIQEAKMEKAIMKIEIKSQKEVQRRIEEEKQKRIRFEEEKIKNKMVHYFSEGIFWNKNTHILSVYGNETKLRAQLATLFTLYIESENYEVTSQKMIDKLWPDGSGNFERCRRLIYDLRHTIPDKYFLIKKGNQGNFRLYFTGEYAV